MERKKILLVGTPRTFDAALKPLLSREGFEVDRLSASFAVIELISRFRFDLIGIGSDVQEPGLIDLIDEIRVDGSRCRSSSVIVVVEGEVTPTVKTALAAGANLTLRWPMAPEDALASFSRLLNVSPRIAARFFTKLNVHLGSGEKKLFGKSENLSATGRLVEVGERLGIGTEVDIEFATPNDPNPIRCRGKVVRDPEVAGGTSRKIGIQFVSYTDDSKSRLEKILSTL